MKLAFTPKAASLEGEALTGIQPGMIPTLLLNHFKRPVELIILTLLPMPGIIPHEHNRVPIHGNALFQYIISLFGISSVISA
jgi:hypothetical protein